MELRKSICDCLDILLGTYKPNMNEKDRKGMVTGWHLGLEDIEDSVILKVIPDVIKGNKFMPTPFDFREECIKPPPLEEFKHKEIEKKQTPEEIEGVKKARNRFFEKMKEIL